jgi:hypothetical protein
MVEVASMKYTLVLQWSEDSINDFDQLINLEDLLEREAGELGDLDGHDMGSGEVNIFFDTDAPGRLFEKLRIALVSQERLSTARVAFRNTSDPAGGYTIIWPSDLAEFKVT